MMDTRNEQRLRIKSKLKKYKAVMIQLINDPVPDNLIKNLEIAFDDIGLECDFLRHGFDPKQKRSMDDLFCVFAGMPISEYFNFDDSDDYPEITSIEKLPSILCVIVNAASLINANGHIFTLPHSIFMSLYSTPTLFSTIYKRPETLQNVGQVKEWLTNMVKQTRIQLFVIGKDKLSLNQQTLVMRELNRVGIASADQYFIDHDEQYCLTAEASEQLQYFFMHRACYEPIEFMESYRLSVSLPNKATQ
jgi:hypothetical protein